MKEPVAQWDDPAVQLVYRILTNDDDIPPGSQHWEGWVARRIVSVLEGRELPPELRGESPPPPVRTMLKRIK